MTTNLILVLTLHLFLSACEAANIQNLGGEWLLREANGKYEDLKATVPGGIYSDLMNNNIIGDIFFGYGDSETKWVPRLNWTYYRNFSVDANTLNKENVNLVLEGLDTFANVFVNGKKVGESRNMFVRYIFDVKDQLKVGNNEIEVQFLSPIEVSARLAEQQSKLYDVPPDCPDAAYRGECHVNMIRKMQASFSWDWGPSFPSVGIWKDIYIESFDESAIRYIVTDVTESEDGDYWLLNFDTYLANNKKGTVTGILMYTVTLKDIQMTQVNHVDAVMNAYNETVVTTTVQISKSFVNTWWPNGYGAHDLYNLNVVFSNEVSSEHDIKNVRVGFRTVELVQDSLDSGLTFYFKINGEPIFMKGSNEIPVDILPERGQNKTTIKKLLMAAHDSHMNMLRVWGGGVYESDYFYDLADELGIVIWQDFMFACAMYQSDENYRSNVIDEVRHQVKRLRSHASVALYSGNNENEGALVDDWYGTKNNFTLYKNDYVTLYIDTIKTEFDRITHNRGIFVSSSPSNGKKTVSDGYVSTYPGNPLYGDVHYYNYVLNPFDSNIYPVPRFASEYGYQSLPSYASLAKVVKQISDLEITSDFMNHRQHHPLGNAQMTLLIEMNLKLPNESSSKYSQAYIFYSQIVHALSIKIETEHYRRFRSSLNNKGEGKTMGALYWQLNDVWLAPSWSGIEHTGKWKMLQYYTQDFFAPIIITGHLNLERTLEIYIVSDLLSPVLNVSASIQVYKWNSFEPVSSETVTVDLEAGHSHLIKSIATDDYLTDRNCGALNVAKNNCFFYLSVEKEGLKITPDNYVFPSKIRDSDVQKPKVQISSVKKISDEQIYSITIETDQIALFVWLESPVISGTFSENGFLMVNNTKTVYFNSEEESISPEELSETLTLTHLMDEQYF
ncbi:beta-mannosidase [Leptinotarsa decemlineata]|uniref:beta-mannosidase n=1 Tax=Leptinotarsa decemlineata TaxID=7539 RepID=UPI003D30CAA5